MTVRCWVEGRVVERSFEDLTELLDRRSRERHPERYAPDGSALMWEQGTSWAEKREAWRRRTQKVAPEPVEEDVVA